MSSWKKAAKTNQKTHRERHQPAARSHLGLLEKKKDYVKRAADYHEKGRTLKLLNKRALNKNPDEFYHHMINSKIKNGEHVEIDKGEENTPEQIKLMQTQDLKYINMKRTQETRRIERLQATLHLVDDNPGNIHTLFVDERTPLDLAARLDTHPALLARSSNRPSLARLRELKLPSVNEETVQAFKKQRDKKYRELVKRIEREKQLSVVQRKMELKRHLQDEARNPLRPRREQRATANAAPVYRFQYIRKK